MGSETMDVRIFDERAHIYLDSRNFVITSMDPAIHDLRLKVPAEGTNPSQAFNLPNDIGVFGYWRYGRIFPLSTVQSQAVLEKGWTLLSHDKYPGWNLGRQSGPIDLYDGQGQQIVVSDQEFVWELLPMDPTDYDDNKTLRKAAAAGQAEVVRVLLAESDADPTTKQQRAIRNAIENGHVETARVLLADYRVNPATEDQYLIMRAADNGNASMVELLLEDPRINPMVANNRPLHLAVYGNHMEIVQILIAHPRFDPFLNDNYSMRWFVDLGQTSVVRMLAAIPGVVSATVAYYLKNPNKGLRDIRALAAMTYALTTHDEDLLIWASIYGALDLMKYLITTMGTNPACFDNSPVAAARQFGQSEVETYLLTLPDVHLD